MNLAGTYLIGGSAGWDNTGSVSGVRTLGLRKNGTTLLALQTNFPDTSSDVGYQNVQAVTVMSAADYVELVAFQNNGIAIPITVAAQVSPELWMIRISSFL